MIALPADLIATVGAALVGLLIGFGLGHTARPREPVPPVPVAESPPAPVASTPDGDVHACRLEKHAREETRGKHWQLYICAVCDRREWREIG